MAQIFISHASKDDDFVKELRVALESQNLPVWVDSRRLRGGAKLTPEIAALQYLYDLEQATRHPQAAAEARRGAIECFLAYRRDGGESYEASAQACAAVANAIQTGEAAAVSLAHVIAEVSQTDITTFAKSANSETAVHPRGRARPGSG